MAQMIKERGGKKTVGTAWNKSQDKKQRSWITKEKVLEENKQAHSSRI